jgi:uroporphyrinogen-III synthase
MNLPNSFEVIEFKSKKKIKFENLGLDWKVIDEVRDTICFYSPEQVQNYYNYFSSFWGDYDVIVPE